MATFQIQKQQIEKFLNEFSRKCQRYSVKLKIDNSSHDLGKPGSCFNFKDKTIILCSQQIAQMSDSLNVPLLDQWKIVAFHELAHCVVGRDEHEAWDWASQNLEVDSDFFEVTKGYGLYDSQLTAKGNWSLIKRALSSPVIPKFVGLIMAGMTDKFRDLGIEFTPGNCWAIARKNGDHRELELIADALLPRHKFDLVHSDDLLELDIAAFSLWKVIRDYL
jgi:hypothetical protein